MTDWDDATKVDTGPLPPPSVPSYQDELRTIFSSVWDDKMRSFSVELDRLIRVAEDLAVLHRAILEQHKECVSKEEFLTFARSLEKRVETLEGFHRVYP